MYGDLMHSSSDYYDTHASSQSADYTHGIRLSQRVNDKVLIVFNSRNEHDRTKFVEDLKESIHEVILAAFLLVFIVNI